MLSDSSQNMQSMTPMNLSVMFVNCPSAKSNTLFNFISLVLFSQYFMHSSLKVDPQYLGRSIGGSLVVTSLTALQSGRELKSPKNNFRLLGSSFENKASYARPEQVWWYFTFSCLGTQCRWVFQITIVYFPLYRNLINAWSYLQQQRSVACRVWKSSEAGTDKVVVVNDFPVQQLKFVPFIRNQDALETSFWSELIVIAHILKKVEELFGRINLLKSQYGAIGPFNESFLNRPILYDEANTIAIVEVCRVGVGELRGTYQPFREDIPGHDLQGVLKGAFTHCLLVKMLEHGQMEVALRYPHWFLKIQIMAINVNLMYGRTFPQNPEFQQKQQSPYISVQFKNSSNARYFRGFLNIYRFVLKPLVCLMKKKKEYNRTLLSFLSNQSILFYFSHQNYNIQIFNIQSQFQNVRDMKC